MQKNNKCIHTCPYVKVCNQIQTKTRNWNLIKAFICTAKNMVYFKECQKDRCKNDNTFIFLGETEKQIETRIQQHLGYIKSNLHDSILIHQDTLLVILKLQLWSPPSLRTWSTARRGRVPYQTIKFILQGPQ